jgi:hypothetical protein
METPCIQTTYRIRSDGYALRGSGKNGEERYVHRYAYVQAYGHIPGRLQVDHLCHNEDPECPGGPCPHRSCVNPDHLEAVPQAVNVARGQSPSSITARTGVCQNGHRMEGYNLITTRGGKNRCRECQRARDRARYKTRKYVNGKWVKVSGSDS